jgi:molecular chaperone GrpE
MTADREPSMPAPEVADAPPEPDRARMTRALRELEAAQARVERDAHRVEAETQRALVAQLLPVLDGLDRTIQAAATSSVATLVQGVGMVRAQLEGVLRSYGVQRIATVDMPFDPGIHEAVGVAPVADRARHAMIVDRAPG